jgi:hypothetical protein
MPVNLIVNGEERMIEARTQWTWPARGMKKVTLVVDRNWYVASKQLSKRDVRGQDLMKYARSGVF